MICAGIDVGSRTIKVVLLDSDSQEIVATGVMDQGVAQDALAEKLLDSLLDSRGLKRNDLGPVVATGYGRKLIRAADAAVTEITCQGWGVHFRMQGVRTVIDIGGQDSKLLRMTPTGAVADFVMNDRCAAGTGRFLEVMSTQLGIQLDELGEMSARSSLPAIISSMCVVFAETEIIGLLASGTKPVDIVAGVQASIATRLASMAGGAVTSPVAFTGGVALVPGMDVALEAVLGEPISVPIDPQTTAALGAAILAARRVS